MAGSFPLCYRENVLIYMNLLIGILNIANILQQDLTKFLYITVSRFCLFMGSNFLPEKNLATFGIPNYVKAEQITCAGSIQYDMLII